MSTGVLPDLPSEPSPAASPGATVVERARGGCREALETLFGECRPALLAQIRRRLGPLLRAYIEPGDILQVTLLHAFEHIDQFAGSTRESFLAWLAGIARNAVRDQADYLRRQRRDIRRTVPLGGEAEAVAAGLRSEVSRLIAGEEAGRLDAVLRSLATPHRQVILLRKAEGLSFREIGERLGKSPDACRMLLARALLLLTRKMMPSG